MLLINLCKIQKKDEGPPWDANIPRNLQQYFGMACYAIKDKQAR